MQSGVSLPALTRQRKRALLAVGGARECTQILGVPGEGLALHLADPGAESTFFAPGGLWQGIVRLAYRLPKLVQQLPRLAARQDASLVLSQLQCAALLANGFLCHFPAPRRGDGRYGAMNMEGCFERRNLEKLKCLLHYFRRVVSGNYTADGLVRFHRRYLRSLPDWENCSQPMFGDLTVTPAGSIEDAPPEQWVQSDFANKILGGGVLGHGLVQEEIRFLICPECIVGRLFCEELTDHEVIVIQGVERFSNYEGYGYERFRWTGDYIDLAPFDGPYRSTTIVAFDAQSYNKSNTNIQFESAAFTRELNKAYCAFFSETPDPKTGIATGNWGAGVFLGHPHLKFLIQMMAAAVAGNRRILYNTWGDADLASQLVSLRDSLKPIGFTVAEMWRCLESYKPSKTSSLLEHVLTCAMGSSR